MVVYDSYPRRLWQELGKRGMDITLSGMGFAILSPVFLSVALAVKMTSKGPAIFAQE